MRKKERLADRQKNADASRAGAGAGKPKIPATGRHRIELEKMECKLSENPKTRNHQLVCVEFKVLQTDQPDDVKVGSSYGVVFDLDREFNEGNCPDADRLQQLVEVIHNTLPEGGPSVEEIYDEMEDDVEAFAGVEVMTDTVRKKSDDGFPYTLHQFSEAEN